MSLKRDATDQFEDGQTSHKTRAEAEEEKELEVEGAEREGCEGERRWLLGSEL